MSDLDKAREHLRHCQEKLHRVRCGYINAFGIAVPLEMNAEVYCRCKNDVLAALSWVWDEQERERIEAWQAFAPKMHNAIASIYHLRPEKVEIA